MAYGESLQAQTPSKLVTERVVCVPVGHSQHSDLVAFVCARVDKHVEEYLQANQQLVTGW